MNSPSYFDLLASNFCKYLESCTIFTTYGNGTQFLIFSCILFRRVEWNVNMKNSLAHTSIR
jgi:hypothetical protein